MLYSLQVQVWRRSYRVAPEAMGEEHPWHTQILEQEAFMGHLHPKEIPVTESLEDLISRIVPFWTSQVTLKFY